MLVPSVHNFSQTIIDGIMQWHDTGGYSSPPAGSFDPSGCTRWENLSARRGLSSGNLIRLYSAFSSLAVLLHVRMHVFADARFFGIGTFFPSSGRCFFFAGWSLLEALVTRSTACSWIGHLIHSLLQRHRHSELGAV